MITPSHISQRPCLFCCDNNTSTVGTSHHTKAKAQKIFDSVIPYNQNSYKELRNLLTRAHVYVSCFGIERVRLDGHKGSISLEAIERHVVTLIKSNREYNEEERADGDAAVDILNEMFERSKVLFKQKNRITKIFSRIINIFKFLFCKRCEYPIYYATFTTYTESQFKIKFGVSPQEYYGDLVYKKRRNGLGTVEDPYTWITPRNREVAQ